MWLGNRNVERLARAQLRVISTSRRPLEMRGAGPEPAGRALLAARVAAAEALNSIPCFLKDLRGCCKHNASAKRSEKDSVDKPRKKPGAKKHCPGRTATDLNHLTLSQHQMGSQACMRGVGYAVSESSRNPLRQAEEVWH